MKGPFAPGLDDSPGQRIHNGFSGSIGIRESLGRDNAF
jgi:hypothetical protein